MLQQVIVVTCMWFRLVLFKWGTLQFLIVVWNTLQYHSNLCITFVIAVHFDEIIIIESGLILFILQPKLRERKATNNL